MNVPSDWWRTFFTGAAVDFWLRAMPEEQTRLECDFIEQMLQVSAPARLLDVPCGGGRHSLTLAARGYHLTGVDLSSAFLNAARSGSAERSLEVRWEHREMRDLPWREEFDGAFCFGNSFGYDEDEGNAAFLQAVAETLKAGARLVLDSSYISEILLPSLQERTWYPAGDFLALAERGYDPLHGRLQVEYTWIRAGRIEKQSMSARLYSYREMIQLFQGAGFRDVQGFGSLAGEPFKFGSQRLLLTATKKGVVS